MNSREKGDIAVGQSIAWYTSHGYELLLPLSDKNKFDVVVYNGSFKKVQCKYTSYKPKGKSVFEVPLVVCGGNRSGNNRKRYKEGDFDLLFVVTAQQEMYEIPWEEVKEYKKAFTLGEKWEPYKLSLNGGK